MSKEYLYCFKLNKKCNDVKLEEKESLNKKNFYCCGDCWSCNKARYIVE